MKKYLFPFILLISLVFISCNGSQKSTTKNMEVASVKTNHDTILIIGSWVQPNPINDKEVQGFMLKYDSVAVSINMHTLLYKKWWQKDDKLTLISESIGNGISFMDTTTYEIMKLDKRKLVLKYGDIEEGYMRE